MLETLVPLKLPPGLLRNGTTYQASGRWHDANLVRFSDGTVGPIGGWQRAHNDDGSLVAAVSGVPRRAVAWRSMSGAPFVAVGSHLALNVFAGGAMHAIHPADFTSDAARVDTRPVSGGGNYGAGPYGVGVYGGGSLASTFVDATTWQLDVFGDHLAGVATCDGRLFVWEGDAGTRAIVPAGAPVNNVGVVCTPERFMVLLGAGGDGRRVAWASQEGYTDWDLASAVNTAGDFFLTTDGNLKCGRRTKNETLLFTDADVHAMRYIGGDFLYRFDLLGDKCGIVAPNAVAVLDSQAMWMSHDNFFAYDGFVKPIPCDVRDYVFGDFNAVQAVKVWATTIAEFGEVWWFYPSAGSQECDRYVVYNYRENHWTTGTLPRTAGVDAGAVANPILFTPDGLLYEHEVLFNHGGAVPFLESGPIELGGGDYVMKIQRIVPDERTLGDVGMTLITSMFPTDPETVNGPYPLAAPTSVRLAARQVRVRVDESFISPHGNREWRLGTFRLGVIQSGRR